MSRKIIITRAVTGAIHPPLDGAAPADHRAGEERVRPAETFAPEVASLNMGSMNFGLYPVPEP